MTRFIISIALLTGVAAMATAHAQTLYSIDQGSDQLRVINPATAASVSSVTITLAGETVNGGNGIATDPATQTLYAILRLGGVTGRVLVTIDPTTGAATQIGNTGLNLAGLAWDCSGNLFGVTGDGGTPPETLFSIDPATGAATEFLPLGRGDDGETIGFNPVDGFLYHASGHIGDYDPITDRGVIFERIDLVTLAITDIPIDGTALVDEEAQALTWWAAQGEFLWKQDHGTGPLFSVTTEGVPTLIGDMDHQAKGLAFVPTFTCPVGGPVLPDPRSIPTVGTLALWLLGGVVVLVAVLALRARRNA
jgi:hypothetical protein